VSITVSLQVAQPPLQDYPKSETIGAFVVKP